MSAGRFGVPPHARDALVAVGVAAALVVTGLSGEHPGGGPGVLGAGLLAAGGLALAGGRRAPVAVLVVTGLCAVGYQAAGYDVPAVAFLFAVYAAVRAGHRAATLAASVGMLVALPLTGVLSGSDAGAALAQGRDALELAWLVAAAAAGEALRQAEQRADEAERTREEAARRRADEERVRIARELHDSLTHQIAIVTVQADVAVHVARRRGEDVPDALLAIQQAGREASRELRATLAALRDDDTAPPRGLDHVAELVDRARGIGLDATLTIDGDGRHVPAAVGRTAYRVVQESLTNVARHAGATTATVLLELHPDRVAIQVDDDGGARPGAAPVPGVGLLGMQERVGALGGRLRALPRTEGGFRVRVELPVDTAP
ncbi:sensor histidine kinase [Cellulomonas sp. NPDC055163]